jgi:hypothetical protein
MQLSPQSLRLLETLALRAKRSFYGMRQGAHRSQRRGHGVEFAEYRQYEVGDNPRAIDWNLYSRSDKLYIKRYLEEENVVLHIILDGSRSMTHPELRQKWDLATYLTLAASYIALATQDPVTISVLGGPHSPRFWGGRAFAPLTRFMRDTTHTIVSDTIQHLDLASSARRLATRVRFPGIALFISDFLYPISEVASALSHFRARNMEIHAVQVLGASDCSLEGALGGATLIDSESGATHGLELTLDSQAAYEKLLASHIAAVRAHCLSHQISFTSARTHSKESAEETALATISSMGLFV